MKVKAESVDRVYSVFYVVKFNDWSEKVKIKYSVEWVSNVFYVVRFLLSGHVVFDWMCIWGLDGGKELVGVEFKGKRGGGGAGWRCIKEVRFVFVAVVVTEGDDCQVFDACRISVTGISTPESWTVVLCKNT